MTRPARRNLTRHIGRVAKHIIKVKRDLNKKRIEADSPEAAQLRYQERQIKHSVKISKKLYSSAVSTCFKELVNEMAANNASVHKLNAFRESGEGSLKTSIQMLYNKVFDAEEDNWQHYQSRAAKLILEKADVDLPTAVMILGAIDYYAETIGKCAVAKTEQKPRGTAAGK